MPSLELELNKHFGKWERADKGGEGKRGKHSREIEKKYDRNRATCTAEQRKREAATKSCVSAGATVAQLAAYL